MTDHQQQKELVREHFTRTAEVFGNYAVTTRVGVAEQLAGIVRASNTDRVVDLACGPGTLALRFARHVRWVCGLDLTPAILERARHSAAEEGLDNLDFAIGDARALPFADGSLDIAVTSYSLHHVPDPARVIGEMARVVKRGGRVGVLDIFVPEDPQVAEFNNRIERLRDASHTRTLAKSGFAENFAAHGLCVVAADVQGQSRAFDHWLLVAGHKPGDRAYIETPRLLEASMANDAACLQPRLVPTSESGEERELLFTYNMLFIAGEKL